MKILAISLAYPPLAYPRSIQVARLLKHTNASTVLFCADEPGARLDATIEPDAEAKLEACIRIPVKKSRASVLTDSLTHRYAREIWNRRNLVPDQYGKWKTSVLRGVTDFIGKNSYKPDVIVTFAQPFTDHLIGMELKRRLQLPWLAHFSDPWVDNPFSPFDATTLDLNLKLERSVAERADILAFTSTETADIFFNKYPPELKEKSRILPQCFDPEQIRNRSAQETGKIIIRYLGNFYGQRTPRPLIEALREIHRTRPDVISDVVFELIGPGNADEVASLASGLPVGLIAARPSVDYRKSLDLMSEANGLLIIDAPAELSVFLPSKLIDYIGAARPVFGITPKGTAASLIRELGGTVADPAKVGDISTGLEKFIAELRNRRGIKTLHEWGRAEVRNRFKAQLIAEEFCSVLKELKF